MVPTIAIPRVGALLAATLLAVPAAQAQPQPQPMVKAARPDPLDPQASVPASSYASSFAGYRGWQAGQAVPWRDANDTVARIGGWRVYTREAQQPDPALVPAAKPVDAAPTAPASPAAPTPPAGHAGHKMP